MCARLTLLLLTAGLLLPRAADAQVMREFGAFGGSENFGAPGPNPPSSGFNNFNGAMSGPMYGGPQASGFGGAPFGGSGTGGAGGMPPNYGWNAEPPGLAGTARFGLRQGFGSGSDQATQGETAQATFLAMSQFTQTLLDPAVDGRGPGRSELDTELAAYADIGNDPTHGGIGRDAYGAIYGRPSLAAPHWNVWAAGFGGSQTSTGSTGSASRSFGTVAGADYSLSPQTRMGFALAGGGTGFANNFSSGRSDLFQAGAFVRHSVGSAYVATGLAYGWQAISNDHPVTPAGSGQLAAAINANAYSGRIEGGYRLASSWLGVTPYAAAQITSFRLPSSTSATQPPPGAANAFSSPPGSDSFTDSRTELGLRTSTSLALAGSELNLRGRLAWAHGFSAGQAIPAAFQPQPGLGPIAAIASLAPNAMLTGVALELRAVNGWSAAANFDSEVSSLLRSYTGKAVLRYSW